MRSVVQHSVLFWAQGEQPPGCGSQRILRTWRIYCQSLLYHWLPPPPCPSQCLPLSFCLSIFLLPPKFFCDRTLHLSQAWPVRLEAPFLRAVAASEAFGSYSMCRSCRECFGGMGGPASSSTGRFTGMAGLESRCDGDGRLLLHEIQDGLSQRWAANCWLGLASSVSAARELEAGRAQESGVSVGGWHGWWVRRGGGDSRLLGARASSDEKSLTSLAKFPALCCRSLLPTTDESHSQSTGDIPGRSSFIPLAYRLAYW